MVKPVKNNLSERLGDRVVFHCGIEISMIRYNYSFANLKKKILSSEIRTI